MAEAVLHRKSMEVFKKYTAITNVTRARDFNRILELQITVIL
jgi:hypothetical protein